ncbi:MULTISPECIES: SpoIIE family protein phosphatase [unclassified Streptomyces]|uniref:SpoIIE family protein phosphatase n=1 Tax=unclassified Streptomyces TaxID=2593676 RepID=UPI00336AE219
MRNRAAIGYTASAVIDARGIVTSWSPEARRLLGYTATEVVGRSAALLLTEDLSESALRSLADRVPWADQSRWHGTVRLRHRDGRSVEARLLVHHRLPSSQGESDWLVVSPVMGNTSSRDDMELLERAFAQQSCPIALYGSDRRLRRANEKMERALGLTQAEMRGLRLSEIVLHPDLEATDKAMREVLETGSPQYRENVFRTPGHGRHQAWAISLAPMRDADGEVNAVCLTAHDETRQYWARQRLQLLNEASATIGSTLDVVRTAQELADVAVRGLADFACVEMLTPRDGGEQTSRLRTGTPVELRHLAHAPESCPEIPPAVDGLSIYAEDSPQGECLATGRTISHLMTDPDSTGSRRSGQAPAGGAARRSGFHLLVVPMRARGVTLGVAVFGRRRLQEAFDPDDLLLAEEMTARAALCIDNARRYTRERSTALTLQRSLLPRRLAPQAAVEVASRYLPASARAGVGGDWFDVIPLSGARVALVVGDVVGHGIQASATMGRLRTAVRTLADVDLSPDELLTHLDDLVTHLADEAADGVDGAGSGPDLAGEPAVGGVGATCLYAVYDPVSRRCTLARAGHPPPFTVTPEGAVSLLDLPAGPPLGLGGLPFESAEVALDEGSLLVLYTDGLIEARDRDVDQGLGILRQALARSTRSLDEACDTVLGALLPDRPQDDVALLIARPHALDTGQVATWDIPADPTAVAEARKKASTQLAEWGLQEAAFTTELVVSELVTNAIRHAEPPIQLRLIHDRTLICEVSDASNTAPHLRRARVFDEGGRGLLLVARFTQGWGTRQSPTGKTIWAEQALSDVAPEPGPFVTDEPERLVV